MDKNYIISALLNIIILLILPFFTIGIIKKTKAFFAGRKGVSIFQPLWDFLRLFKKGQVISNTTSQVFKIAPVVVFATTLFAGLFAPMIGCCSIIEIEGAFVIFSYILGLGKFFSLIAAMDTGSSFEGMGASREACFTTIIEPAFFIILASFIALNGNLTFKSLTGLLNASGGFGVLIIALSVVSLFIMLIVECARVPFDDPTTHLELTMVHEVMILDNSGIDLGILTWSAGMKMIILASLITNLIIPSSLSFGLSILAYILSMAFIALIIGVIESAIARFRMSHVFEFVFIMSSLALVVASLAVVKIYGV